MSVSQILCDWLDTTHPVEHPSYDEHSCDSFISDVTLFLSSVGGEVVSSADESYKTRWRLGDGGSFTVDHTPRFLRLSASGTVLAHLRATGTFLRYLSLLASVPHRITRLDVAGDRIGCSPPQVIAALRKKYPKECSLGRKSLRTSSVLSSNADGRQTGTFYIGNRKQAKQTARIYDKSHQMLEVHQTPIEPTTRYEFTTTSKHGASLCDASEPVALFWHYASQFLTKPPKTPLWAPHSLSDWNTDPFEPTCAGAALKSSVKDSKQLQVWLALCLKEGGGGTSYLRSLLNADLDKLENSQD